MMTRLDFIILGLLINNNALNESIGLTVNEIVEICPVAKGITVYKRLNFLNEKGYVKKGFKSSKAHTFFITDEGIKLDSKYSIKTNKEENI